VLTARIGILAVALCAYVLAALFAERRRHESVLAESEARLQEALTAGAVTTFVWEVGKGSSQRSTNAAEILGFDPRQPFTAASFFSRVHADDREHLKALMHDVRPERPAYTATFRYTHPDGRELWLEEIANAEFDSVGQLARIKGLTIDVTARKRSEDQRSLAIAALDHRLKDLLARVIAVARDSRQEAGTLEAYGAALERRILSMADAHALLSRNRGSGADLAELVRGQLAPGGTDANTTVEGPDVMLTVAATQTLAMVLHELATNAAKYGALSTPHGRVEVSWSRDLDEDAKLTIIWREVGGPTVAVAPEERYGVGIIRNLVPRELGGLVDLAFAPGGVSCRIEIPGAAAK
jgi:PAS domain S-box-containing protein